MFRRIWESKKGSRAISIGAFVVFAAILLTNAWMVDDAYITLRTIDNFVNGHGLTWNVSERVQTWTHALWMLLVSAVYAVTREAFFTVIVLSVLLVMLSALISRKALTPPTANEWWKGPLLVLALLSSKAVVDYASSGLENPLSYLIASLFMLILLRIDPQRAVDERRMSVLVLLASLAYVNRPDTILLYLPALAWVLWRSRPVPKRRLARMLLISTLPITIWLAFSLLYFGFPFPNTAYAKALSTGIPLGWRIQRGLEYQVNSLSWDTASYVMLGFALVFALARRSSAVIALMAGIAVYMMFVVVSGGAATHQSGRFYAVPLFIAVVLFVDAIGKPRRALAAGALLVGYIAWSPVSAVKFGTPAYKDISMSPSRIDAKLYVFREGAALLNWRPGRKMPDNQWYDYGLRICRQRRKVHVGGAYGGEPIGLVGFAAGPGVHIIDKVGLGDPLLARLPAQVPARREDWKSGHFHRTIPDGYVESIESETNEIREPHVREYYEILRAITRGPVFDTQRFRLIANMNLGRYDYLIVEGDSTGLAASPRPLELADSR